MNKLPPDERQGYPEPADPVTRIAAKVIDLLLAAMLAKLVPPIGMVMGIVYLLVGDGLEGGRSVGKRLLGLRVIHPETREPATTRQSILRNVHLAVLFAFMFLPILGYVLAVVLGTFTLAVELYAIFNDPHGLRMGDLFAESIVVGHAWAPVNQNLESRA